MQQFFFHLKSRSRLLVDCSGYVLLDLDEARGCAAYVVRKCIETVIVQGGWRDGHVHVVDEEGEEVFVTPFSDVVGRLH